MNIRNVATSFGIASSFAIALSSAPAQAFSFQTNYTAALSGSNQSKGDIFLDSVTLGDGQMISDFTLITSANILSNDLYTGGNSGAASADIGDLATTGIRLEKATNDAIKTVLNNQNLNNIIDTEDKGTFVLDLNFEKAVDNVFIWERGMNSRLDIQALDANGEAIGNLLELSNSKHWDYAGYDINTKEIGSAQRVGSTGVSLADLGIAEGSYISSLRVHSSGKSYNGPDFKILGSVAESAQVPEPSSLLGLGAIVAGAIATRRRKQSQDA